jgi:predicted ATP-grasp superfamily ATP-dependent carboligase
MRVLVLDGDINPAVTSVRALSKAGYKVSVGATGKWSKAGWSRFCDNTFRYPSISTPTAFAQCIAEQASREPGTFVLPLSEPSVLAVSAHRSLICGAGGRIVMPSHATLLRAVDKVKTTALAKSLGIRVPQSLTISNDAEAEQAARQIPFPVVLKPRSSEEISSLGNIVATAHPVYARNREELLRGWDGLKQRCNRSFVGEWVPGDGVLYCVLMEHGELRAEFFYKRVRCVHPTGWGAALRVSLPVPAAVREAGLTLLNALDPDWHGVACIEFRLKADGTPVYLETNPRIWHSLAVAVYAGVNFPVLLARMAEHGTVERQEGYRSGLQCRWLLGDFRNLLYTMFDADPNFPGEWPGRFEALRKFITPVPGTYHDNLVPEDPLPAIGDVVAGVLRVVGIRQRTGPLGRTEKIAPAALSKLESDIDATAPPIEPVEAIQATGPRGTRNEDGKTHAA